MLLRYQKLNFTYKTNRWIWLFQTKAKTNILNQSTSYSVFIIQLESNILRKIERTNYEEKNQIRELLRG
jgi:hypothetical protein